LSSNPETTKPPTFRRSSPIRQPAVHPVVNRQLSVSDRPPIAALSTSIDSVFPSVCQLPFQLPLRPDTPSVCLFYRPPPSIDTLSLLCVDCAFSISAARSFSSINWDTAISVEFLVLQLFFLFRRFFVACADTSFVQAKQKVTAGVKLCNRTVIEPVMASDRTSDRS